MRRRLGIALATGLACASASPAQQCPEGPVGLVLSGGGARGYAHLGVLRTLDSLRIRPDLIVGTSIGAIVGGLYASGYSARQIDSVISGLGTRDPFDRIGPRVPRAWGALLPLVSWEQGEHGVRLQNPAVREAYVNAYLSAILLEGNLRARGDFDRLPIRFRAIATDLASRRRVVLGDGDLARAVRASMAIPLVFSPTRIDGRALTDGGLSANIPVDVARELGARRVIVSDVTEGLADTVAAENPLAVADQLMGFLFSQRRDSLSGTDAYIRPDVRGFRALDFDPQSLRRLEVAGRRTAETVLARAACFAPAAPVTQGPVPWLLGTVTVTGGHPGDRRLLTRALGLDRDPLDRAELRRGLMAIGDGDPFQEVWLTPQGGGDTIRFEVQLERAPRRVAGAGLGYDSDLSGRFWAGLLDRRLGGIGVELSLVGAVGRFRDDVTLSLRRTSANIGHGRTPLIRAFGGREQVRHFDSAGVEVSTLPTDQARLFLGLEQQLGADWLLELGGEAISWENPDGTARSTTAAAFRAAYQPDGSPRLMTADVVYSGTWQRVQLSVQRPLSLGRLRLEPVARLGWGRHLPIHERFVLGGETLGFPGLRTGERRGDREALLGLQASWAIRLPLALRVLAAAGRSSTGGAVLADDAWLGGIRSGLGIETPVGPLELQYGVASNGSDAVFFRAGRWF